LLLKNLKDVGYRTQNITTVCVSTLQVLFLGEPPPGGLPNSLRIIVSQTPVCLYIVSFNFVG